MFERWTYLAVFAFLVAASFGLPIPEDVPLLTGGYLCFAGFANIYIMLLVGMLGVLTGDLFLFCLGRKLGHQVVQKRFFRRFVNPSRLVLAERLFARHGVKIIFIGRFLPGLRPMIFTASGILKVPFSTFLVTNGLAACISVPTLVLLGNFFGTKLDTIKGGVRSVTHIMVIVAALATIVATGIYLHRRQKALADKVTAESGIEPETFEKIAAQKTNPTDSHNAGEEAA